MLNRKRLDVLSPVCTSHQITKKQRTFKLISFRDSQGVSVIKTLPVNARDAAQKHRFDPLFGKTA